MAVATQTISTGAFTTGALTITKPSGLAVGDLMVAIIHAIGNIGASPSGWTTTITKQSTGAAINTRIDWKIADSSDVAASNFTWAIGAGGSKGGGILRITGHNSTNPMGQLNSDGTVTTSTTPSYATTITPTEPNSLLIFSVGVYNASNPTFSTSGYAIVTSNPSWTEAFDLETHPSNACAIAVAYGSRPQVTATGNASAVISSAPQEQVGILFAIRPPFIVTATETVTCTDNYSFKLFKIFTESIGLTDLFAKVKSTFTNQSKNSSTWTNQTKN